MDVHQITLYVTLEQETAIQELFFLRGWKFLKCMDLVNGVTVKVELASDEKEHNDAHLKTEDDNVGDTSFIPSNTIAVEQGNNTAFLERNSSKDAESCDSEETVNSIKNAVCKLDDEDGRCNSSLSSCEVLKQDDVKHSYKDNKRYLNMLTDDTSNSTISFDSDYNSFALDSPQNIQQIETDKHSSSYTNKIADKCFIFEKSASDAKSETSKSTITNKGKKQDKKYQCTDCNRKYFHLSRFKEHKCYTCEFCQKKFKLKCYYLTHRKRHVQERKHKCSICEKAFYENYDLVDHMKVHEGKMDYICDFCGKEFSQQKALYSHRYNQHINPPVKGEFKCDQCDLAFPFRERLKNHVAFVHTKERPFLCVKCGKGFKNKFKLQAHAFSHTEIRPFNCEHGGCGKSFKNKHTLRSHSRRHIERNHVCDQCGKSFFDKRGLDYHTRTHTGFKPCLCTICDYRCNHPPNLRKHMKIHEKKQRASATSL
ncbi:gastrula zinc finger protein XlCGF57.1-like [Mya arenaria]|uniref:gastrula zinc finger protein XlCGF57.1-like n=1 Tax=Mya arenaria TaxID=6604 RepID=UPI0022E3BCAD|nr:gastrula zinc finger protein XlCGF57.1-like [Mya arenaria]